MRDYALAILAVFIGFSALTLSMACYNNSISAQKIENIKQLNSFKEDLNMEITILETRKNYKEIERLVDSMNNIK